MDMKIFSGKKIVITGGVGFIGSNLAKRFNYTGADVTLIDSLIPEYGGNLFNIHNIERNVRVNLCDVRDSYALKPLLEGCDFLFNLAGQTSHMDSMLHPQVDLNINAAAQLSILEICREVSSNVKIVFASTRQIYGKPAYLPVNENHTILPVDVNGINKVAGESYHLLYNNVYGIRSCALRLTNTYGPGMRIKDARQTFLGVWIKSLLNGEPIHVYGDGLQLRDFNFVDDCVDAILLASASDSSNGKVYNLGSTEVVSLSDLAKKMVQLGYGGNFIHIPFPQERKLIDIGDYYGDFSLISSELGWTPKVDLDDGLMRTVDFYKSHLNKYL